MRASWWLALVVAASLAIGCNESKDDGEPKRKKRAASDDDETSSDEPARDESPSVAIAAGTLRVGSKCQDIPRVRPDELDHVAIDIDAFSMDLHPYPNEAGKPALLGASWTKALELCADRGKRLCTELEWERACKGDDNKTYQWGDGFDPKKNPCPGQRDHMLGARAACKSPLGVMDMTGVAAEWTSSDWERGPRTGDKVVRGSGDNQVSWVNARCAYSRKRDPNTGDSDIGFRCCSGDAPSAKVVLPQRVEPAIASDRSVDRLLDATMMKSMPPDHRSVPGVALSFDEAYRWHPVANEEMLVGRWRGTPSDGDPFYELAVFKLCDKRAWLTARMRGPVAGIGNPKVGADHKQLSFDVHTDKHRGAVKLTYWHGSVKLVAPDWVKSGNQLKVKADTRLRIPKLKLKK